MSRSPPALPDFLDCTAADLETEIEQHEAVAATRIQDWLNAVTITDEEFGPGPVFVDVDWPRFAAALDAMVSAELWREAARHLVPVLQTHFRWKVRDAIEHLPAAGMMPRKGEGEARVKEAVFARVIKVYGPVDDEVLEKLRQDIEDAYRASREAPIERPWDPLRLVRFRADDGTRCVIEEERATPMMKRCEARERREQYGDDHPATRQAVREADLFDAWAAAQREAGRRPRSPSAIACANLAC
jgi:hypothetical protein